MRKEQLTVRQQFELAYRRWRMYGESDDFVFVHHTGHSAQAAAEYAYDAKDYVVTGWSSRSRYTTWVMKNLLRDPSWGIPF